MHRGELQLLVVQVVGLFPSRPSLLIPRDLLRQMDPMFALVFSRTDPIDLSRTLFHIAVHNAVFGGIGLVLPRRD